MPKSNTTLHLSPSCPSTITNDAGQHGTNPVRCYTVNLAHLSLPACVKIWLWCLCEMAWRQFSNMKCRNSTHLSPPCQSSWIQYCKPNTASAGENSLSSLKEALMPSITQGRWSCQSAAAARDRKASFNRLWNRSTNPFD
jgi:hypothetical protein